MGLSTLRVGRRRSAILPTLVIVAVLVVAFAIFTSVWTDRLWYRLLRLRLGVQHDAADPDRPVRGLRADHGRRVVGQRRDRLPAAPAAGRGQRRPARCWSATASCWRPGSSGSCRPSASLVGLFAGGAASGQVLDYLAWRNATPFGVTDPQFGLDVGFFVFGYPWWRFVAVVPRSPRWSSARSWPPSCTTRWAACGSAARAGAAAGRPRRTCPSWSGWPCWSRASATGSTSTAWRSSRTNRLFTGITYTADNATVNAKMILAIIAGICALLFFANAVLRRWVVPTIGLVLLLLSAIVLGLVYPGAVQYFSVRPDEPDKERDYIAAQHRRHPGGVRGGQGGDHRLLGEDDRVRRAS